MKLLTLPLMVLAAPILLLLRSHFGLRVGLALIACLWAPVLLPGFLNGLLGNHRAGTSIWPAEIHAYVKTHTDIMAAVIIGLGVIQVLILLWRGLGPRHQRTNPGDFGAFVATPSTPFTIIFDLARAGMVAVIVLGSGIVQRLDSHGTAWTTHLAVMATSAVILLLLARANGNVLPGWDGSFLNLAAGFRRLQPLWNYTARLAKSARASRADLGSIFSRRPKDLRAIASNSAHRGYPSDSHRRFARRMTIIGQICSETGVTRYASAS